MSNVRRCVALAVLLAAVACAGTRKEHAGVPLVWLAGQENPVAQPLNLAAHRFKVLPFVDRRSDPSVIGVNVQDPAKPLKVTTRDDVAVWARDRFVEVLRRQGFELVEAGETHTIQVEVQKFLVTEAGLFNGDVELTASVAKPGGQPLWRGAMAGRSKRFGRTYSLENYYEALTNAFEDAAKKLGENPAFVAALGGK